MKIEEKPFHIDIRQVGLDFETHISQAQNDRLIFSGGFGTGKTYFLNDFFNTNEEYEAIHLYPVNYSVASNEDIFELIKYDIIIELFIKGVDIKKIDFDKFLTAQFFVQNKLYDIVSLLLESAFKIKKSLFPLGEVILELKKKAESLKKEYDAYHKDVQIDDRKYLEKYLNDFESQKGNIYEDDSITALIRELITQIKLDKKKQVVLIIDDLDRIDPEHIFRLLNVFSAHFDYHNTSNKFAFDKVIFVCDIENIRNIFHAKYGSSVDFSGYIDKFYSKEIFNFDNSIEVAKRITNIFSTIEVDEKYKGTFDLRDLNKRVTNEIGYIIQGMIKVNALNLRSLIKLRNNLYIIRFYEIKIQGRIKHNWNFNIILIFNFLRFVFGNDSGLANALKRCAQVNPNDIYDQFDRKNTEKLGNLIPILDPSFFIERMDGTSSKYHDTTCDVNISFKVETFGPMREGIWGAISHVDFPERIKYFVLLEKTYQEALKAGLLK